MSATGKTPHLDLPIYVNGNYINFADFNNAMTKIDDAVYSNQNNTENTGTQVTELQQQVAGMQQSVTDVVNQTNTTNQNLTDLQSQVNVNTKHLDDVQQDLNGITGETGAINNSIATIQGNVLKNTNDIKKNTNDINLTKTQVNTMQTDLENVIGDAAEIDSDLAAGIAIVPNVPSVKQISVSSNGIYKQNLDSNSIYFCIFKGIIGSSPSGVKNGIVFATDYGNDMKYAAHGIAQIIGSNVYGSFTAMIGNINDSDNLELNFYIMGEDGNKLLPPTIYATFSKLYAKKIS